MWAKQFRPSKKSITFVRAGEQPNPSRRTSADILTSARDWQLLVELEHQLKFPSHIAVTTMQPDIVLVSEFTRQLVLTELNGPLGRPPGRSLSRESSPNMQDRSVTVSRLVGE